MCSGRRYAASSVTRALALYVLYLGVMLVNGVSEAHHAATARPRALRTYSLLTFPLALVQTAASAAMMTWLDMGVSGLIWGNIFGTLSIVLCDAS